jgi:hypothetical protein
MMILSPGRNSIADWRTPPRRITALIALALAMGSPACMSTSKQTQFMKNRPEVKLTAGTAEMRLRTVAYARRAAGLIEESATEIGDRSDDPTVRKATLQWKLRAIPMVHEAALQPDPLLAAADLWAFSLQMKAFFSDGDGKETFGSYQEIALATCEELVVRGESVIRAAVRGDNIDGPRKAIQRFALENPIRTKSLRRESISVAYADVLFAQSKSTFAAVGDVEQTARDIDYRLGFLSEYMLKQARWTVELALLDAVDRMEIEEAMGALEESLEGLRVLANEVPAMMELQRDALFLALAMEREATLGAIDAQRVDTLMALSRERQAVFDGVDAQRNEIFALLSAEREAVVTDLEGVVERSLVKVVDHAFWRLLQIGIAAAVVALPFLWLRARGQRAAA